MQMPPSEMLRLSLWEFAAMVHGWNKANAPADKPEPLDEETEEELFEFINEKPIWVN